MTSLEQKYGSVIAKNDRFVVRCRQEEDGAIVVMAHPIKDGHEHRPLAFIEGFNYLRLEGKEKS